MLAALSFKAFPMHPPGWVVRHVLVAAAVSICGIVGISGLIAAAARAGIKPNLILNLVTFLSRTIALLKKFGVFGTVTPFLYKPSKRGNSKYDFGENKVHVFLRISSISAGYKM